MRTRGPIILATLALLISAVTFKFKWPIELPSIENSVSGISAIARYENIDFLITPRDGFSVEMKAGMNREAIGSDFDFQQYSCLMLHVVPRGPTCTSLWVLPGIK